MLRGKKSGQKNQTFVFLYAIAIIMVIDDHCDSRIGINTALFPYNSFYMPLFVFCSGYFFKIRSWKDSLMHRVKKQLVPYILYDIVMIVLAIIIDKLFKTNWYKGISLKSVALLLFDRPTTELNGPAWFVIMLFWVSTVYSLIRCVIYCKKGRDYFLTALFTTCGFAALYICVIYPKAFFPIRMICRTVFYLQFYHLGYMFRNYFESALKKTKKLVVCSICVAVNVVLILAVGDKINFGATHGMANFHYVVLPLITSISGILFYYEIMSFAAEKIGERKEISFIARNTFVIMQLHLLFINIPDLYVFYKVKHGSEKYPDFPVESYINNVWTRYSPNTRLIGFFCGLVGSLLVAYVMELIKERREAKRSIG